MNKKKIIRVILLIIIIAILLFGVVTARKIIIFKDLEKKMSKLEIDNYYEKVVQHLESQTMTTEYYCKGNKAVVFLNVEENGKSRKITTYYEDEEYNCYYDLTDYGGTKLVYKNTNGFPKVPFIKYSFDDLGYLFKVAITSSIKSAEYDGKKCYYMIGNEIMESYVEKETGLVRKVENNEYSYEFGNIDDSVFVEPDISEYQVQEN